jgi:uncharacterized cupredoxin-like copper-binding protein
MRALSTMLAATALVLLPVTGLKADPGHHGHSHPAETAYGRPGDPAKGGRVIQVAMRETPDGMAFTPEKIEIAGGEQVSSFCATKANLSMSS